MSTAFATETVSYTHLDVYKRQEIMSLKWINKQDGIDDVLADDINSLAAGVIETQQTLDQKVDADDVYTKTESDVLLENKVDKVEGKGLSELATAESWNNIEDEELSEDEYSVLHFEKQNGTTEDIYFYDRSRMKQKLSQKADKSDTLAGLSLIHILLRRWENTVLQYR